MKTVFKGITFALTAAVLFSLCLTPTAFATVESSAAMHFPMEEVVEGSKLLTATPSDAGDAAEQAELLTAAPSDAEEIEEDVELLTLTPSDAEKLEEDAKLLMATPSDAEKLEEDAKLLTATPSDAEETEEKAVLLTATPAKAVEDTVSTGEELMEWLSSHKDIGGAVKLTDDISLGDFYYARSRDADAVTVDTGVFSITADGYVYLQATSPLMIRGIGGEQGVLRSSGMGSLLHLNSLVLESEDGYAVFQEEGTGFISENTVVSGEVHYADRPFVCEWEPALTVVERGKTLDAGMLPATLSARVNRQGQVTHFYEDVPVTWDLAGHEEDQKMRRRFTVPGMFVDMASQNAPVCTLAYDDFPLTFLDVNVRKTMGTWGDSYRLTGSYSKPADRLPITVQQEYSFDRENWTTYQETTATSPSSGFSISLFVRKEDLERVPEFFIRLCWNDDKTVYYSNILRFDVDSFEANEEPGGNRGGGTDIIDPPGPPETVPAPEITPPGTDPAPEITPPGTDPAPEITPPGTDSAPETVLPPVTSPSTPGRTEQGGTDHEADGNGDGETTFPESSDGRHEDAEEPSHGIVSPPGASAGSSDSGLGQPLSVPKPSPGPASEPALSGETVIPTVAPEPVESQGHTLAAGETPDVSLPVKQPDAPAGSDDTTVPPSSEDSVEILAKPELKTTLQGKDVLPSAAGLMAIAACMGGAALYLYPETRKRLLQKLRNIIKR